MTNLSTENIRIRQAAKELTHQHFWRILGMLALTVFAPMAFSVVVAALLALTQNETLISLGSFVMTVALALMEGGLMLGLGSALLDLCRGEQNVPVSRVFSRMKDCHKGVGLNLWVGLKIFLWALPPYALAFVLGLYIGMNSNSTPSDASYVLMMILPVLILILVCALVIPAVLRYALSTYILVDKPETSVFDCVKQSKAMMQGHKWQLFKLPIPIFLMMLLIDLAVSVVLAVVFTLLKLPATSIVCTSIAALASFVASMYYMIRYIVCAPLFYLKRSEGAE